MTNMAIGGYKIVYEYANRLTCRGHKLSLLFLNTNYLKAYHMPMIVKKVYFDILHKRGIKWFVLNDKVEKISDYSLKRVRKLFAETDVAIATAVGTASYVAENFRTKNKIYLIQGRENWSRNDGYVDSTYRLGMKNVVVSQWLKDIVDGISDSESVLIRNPIDLTEYNVTNPQHNRKKYTLSVLFNPNPVKGFSNAFQVILMLKKKYPELEVKSFGAYPRPNYFPKWIEYIKNANQKQTIDVYNKTQVFLCSSINEGYGLTGLEAMACGCALCSTNYSAVYEYAVSGTNCLLSNVGDINAQFNNVSMLFDDDLLRKTICENAVRSVQDFSWDVALGKFLNLLRW